MIRQAIIGERANCVKVGGVWLPCCVVANFGGGWYNDRVEGEVSGIIVAKKRLQKRSLPQAGRHDVRLAALRRAERRMDALLRRLLSSLGRDELDASLKRWGELVTMCPELRLDLNGHAESVAEVVRCLEEGGELAVAVRRLCAACVTPTDVRRLRSSLYTIAARFADTHPELVPAVALAALSLDETGEEGNAFVEMVVCASAVEQARRYERHPPFDACAWLAAEPSPLLIGAVGEGLAYYYAAIPGVLLCLDRSRVLFDVGRLSAGIHLVLRGSDGRLLRELVDEAYKDTLRAEIWRAWGALRQRCMPGALVDVEVLFGRALESLDVLPPHLNPLLQAIFVQSWVRYLETL